MSGVFNADYKTGTSQDVVVTALPAISGSVSVINSPVITATVSVLPAISGSVSVINTPVITASVSVLPALVAGTAVVGYVYDNPQINLYNGSTQLTLKNAVISASTSGAGIVITSSSGVSFLVLGAQFMGNGVTNVKFQSATTDMTGLAYVATNVGMVMPINQWGWFMCNTGQSLNINLSAAVAVGGMVRYVEV